MNKEYSIIALEDWDVLAASVLTGLTTPTILTLSGPLGAGKTTFVQALARALGVTSRPRSPTFSLLRTYVLPKEIQGIRRLVHIDAYRLETISDLYALDLEGELAEPGTVIALEWPEQVGDALEKLGVKIVSIKIEQAEGTKRVVTISV